MIDAILHCLDCVGKAEISLWTWTVAEYEIQCLERLMLDKRLTGAALVIDHGARGKNKALLDKWTSIFGPHSIKLVVNHSKIATIKSADYKLLLRGSMNLNFNPRFEQLDVREGGADYDLVKMMRPAMILGLLQQDAARLGLISPLDRRRLDVRAPAHGGARQARQQLRRVRYRYRAWRRSREGVRGQDQARSVGARCPALPGRLPSQQTKV
jgi:hypothetical protein